MLCSKLPATAYNIFLEVNRPIVLCHLRLIFYAPTYIVYEYTSCCAQLPFIPLYKIYPLSEV